MKMEYVFGILGTMETVRTKGGTHSDLKGFQRVRREFPDQVITDGFQVVRKLKSDQDQEGNCYDWYEIDQHYRAVDKSKQVEKQSRLIDGLIVSTLEG